MTMTAVKNWTTVETPNRLKSNAIHIPHHAIQCALQLFAATLCQNPAIMAHGREQFETQAVQFAGRVCMDEQVCSCTTDFVLGYAMQHC